MKFNLARKPPRNGERFRGIQRHDPGPATAWNRGPHIPQQILGKPRPWNCRPTALGHAIPHPGPAGTAEKAVRHIVFMTRLDVPQPVWVMRRNTVMQIRLKFFMGGARRYREVSFRAPAQQQSAHDREKPNTGPRFQIPVAHSRFRSNLRLLENLPLLERSGGPNPFPLPHHPDFSLDRPAPVERTIREGAAGPDTDRRYRSAVA